ncbi:MAG: CvpA family protein [Acidobacteriota bacterium]
MNFNWLDVVLALILAASIVRGLVKGLARTGIGLASVVVGVLCGLWFYGVVGGQMRDYISSRPLANLAGFLVIFTFVVVLGWLLGMLLERLLKLVHLSWLNRLLGGAFGAVRGVLLCTVIVFVLMAFAIKPPPRAVAESRLAPYVMGAARVMAYAAPHDVRASFHGSYDKLKGAWKEMFEKKAPRKLEADKL